MARVIGDLCFPAGKYVKDGQEKTRWMKVGILLETDKGMRVKLDAIPVVTGDNGLWLSCFEKDEPQQGFREKPAPAPAQGDLDDDTPF
jgi:hypothetical protein